MALYTIHAPPGADGAAVGPADMVFVKDGYCWPALLIPLVWSFYRRLWLVVLLLLAALLVFVAAAEMLGAAALPLYLLGRVYYGLEANGLRRWTLERRGYRPVGVTQGRTIAEAEYRFFAEGDAGATFAPSVTPAPATERRFAPTPRTRTQTPADPHVVGLFPAPGPGQ